MSDLSRPVITPDVLVAAIGCQLAQAHLWAGFIDGAMRRWQINTPRRQAAFLAQIAHESNRLSRITESLYYTTPERLLLIFPRHFDNLSPASGYVRNPDALANRVYANRMGNGPSESGDGWRYRGRGLIQITGKNNYRACANGIGAPLLDQPDLLEQHGHAAESAAWYWTSHGCNALADADRFPEITKVINGGLNGMADRLALWTSAKKALGVTE